MPDKGLSAIRLIDFAATAGQCHGKPSKAKGRASSENAPFAAAATPAGTGRYRAGRARRAPKFASTSAPRHQAVENIMLFQQNRKKTAAQPPWAWRRRQAIRNGRDEATLSLRAAPPA
jgi:hypothetical protein